MNPLYYLLLQVNPALVPLQYLHAVFVDYDKLWGQKGRPFSKKHLIDLIQFRIKSADKRLLELNKTYYDHLNFSMSIETTLINIIEDHFMDHHAHNDINITFSNIIDNINHFFIFINFIINI